MNNEYFLKLNSKKTQIVDITKSAFSILGYRFMVRNKKTIIKIRQETFKKIKRNIKEKNYQYNSGIIKMYSYFSFVSNYENAFKYSNSYKIKNYLEINLTLI